MKTPTKIKEVADPVINSMVTLSIGYFCILLGVGIVRLVEFCF